MNKINMQVFAKQSKIVIKTKKTKKKNTHRFKWFDRVPTSTEQWLKLSTMLFEGHKRVFTITWYDKIAKTHLYPLPYRGVPLLPQPIIHRFNKKNISLNSFPPLSTALNSDIGLLFLHKCDSLNMSDILQQQA